MRTKLHQHSQQVVDDMLLALDQALENNWMLI